VFSCQWPEKLDTEHSPLTTDFGGPG